MMKRILAVALCWLIASAHIGSPDVWFDGPAGPYSVRVLIRPPRVVPGLADIVIRVRGGAERVQVVPARWDTGAEGAPPPDAATRVRGDAELFSAQLWLMARGAYRIAVTIDGARGRGTAVVPVTATATQRLEMPRAMSIVLLGVLGFLLAGLWSLVGAAVRESVLPPGEIPDVARRRRARFAMAGTALITALLLLGGWRWWSAVDAYHRARLDRPWSAHAHRVVTADGTSGLRFAIADSLWLLRRDEQWLSRNPRQTRAALLPDHGKLMHMFLVRTGDLGAFAHLHPVSHDFIQFDVALPALPAGTYRIFADIVEESGATHTLVASLELDGARGAATDSVPAADPDDAAWIGPPLGSLDQAMATSSDSLTLHWRGPRAFTAGQETNLVVQAVDSDGAPVPLEPYMGMPAHMVIQRADDSVFVHLHPLGTISTAAQQALSADLPITGHAARSAAGGPIEFPYAFPAPGRYRIWVQVRHQARVHTGAFDVEVGWSDADKGR
jgi:hypothetical protein